MAVKAQGQVTITDVSDGKDGVNGKDGAPGRDGQTLVATCPTAAATAAKVAALSSGTLELREGASVAVVMANENTAASPTLNVAGTGARAIVTNGTNSAYWSAGSSVAFVYQGGAWQVASSPVYAGTADVGAPSGRHIHIDSDSIDFMDGSVASTTIGSDRIELGKNLSKAEIDLLGGLASLKSETGTKVVGSGGKPVETQYNSFAIESDHLALNAGKQARVVATSTDSAGASFGAELDVQADSSLDRYGKYPVISASCSESRGGASQTSRAWMDHLSANVSARNVYLNGSVSASSLGTSGSLSSGADLSVGGTATVAGAATANGGLTVNGTTALNGSVKFGGTLAGSWTGSVIKTVGGTEFQLLSASEFKSITGHDLDQGHTYIGLCSGDDAAMRSILTASIQVSNGKPIAVICTSSKNLPKVAHRFNYHISIQA